jgi:DNA-binding NtrC family response regulator
VVATQAGAGAGNGGVTARTSSGAKAGERVGAQVGAEPTEAEGSHFGPTVLIVEDEPHLLRLLARVFGLAGFRVLSASDGRSAVEVFEQHRDEIAAAFVDVGIPPQGAPQLLDDLFALRPDLGIVLMSGDNLDAELNARLVGCGGRFIRKPFAGAAAVQTVREVLGGAAG